MFTLVNNRSSVTIKPQLSSDGKTLKLMVGDDYPVAIDLQSDGSLNICVWEKKHTDLPDVQLTIHPNE